MDEIEGAIEEFRTRSFDVTAKHFHEAVSPRPMSDGSAFERSCTWTKGVLQSRGLVTTAPKRSVHRKKRVRRPLFAMMLFQDGSRHTWLPQGAELDLIAIMDDATSRILSIFLVEEEGMASTFQGLEEVVAQHGRFSSFYAGSGEPSCRDRPGWRQDRPPPPPGRPRAREQLGIQHIASSSPEGRGRRERVWGRLQKRVPPLLRTAAPADERGVAHDNTVRHERRLPRIPEQSLRRHFVKAKVRVHQDPDGTLAIFHGSRRLARSAADGTLHDPDAVT